MVFSRHLARAHVQRGRASPWYGGAGQAVIEVARVHRFDDLGDLWSPASPSMGGQALSATSGYRFT